MNRFTLLGAASAAAAAFLSGTVSADTLEVDVNNFSVTVTNDSDPTTPETLTISDNVGLTSTSSTLNGGFPSLLPVTDFTGVFTLDAGAPAQSGTITGTFTLVDDDGNSYSVASASGTYEQSDDFIGMSDFLVNTSGGLFTFADPTVEEFGGVAISRFADPTVNGSLFGSFFNFMIDSSIIEGGGTDSDADGELLVVVPSPSAALGGLGLLGVVAAGRTRRRLMKA
jgi:hypothetical protein